MMNRRIAAGILDDIYNGEITLTQGKEKLNALTDYKLYAYAGRAIYIIIDELGEFYRYNVNTGTWHKD